jgi:S1-C subfamily serine protease
MDVSVRALVWLILPALAAICAPGPAPAQDLVPLFRKVSPSVGVIRAKGRDVTASGQVRFNETGSGVLISADGKMMTAAHVVDRKPL